MFKNLIVNPALFAVYVALVFSFIGCAVMNPPESEPPPVSTIDENWTAVSTFPGILRYAFQSMMLTNGDILVMGGNPGGFGGFNYLNDIWLSSDNGSNWNEITNQAPWGVRLHFQAVLLPNNDILIMGGFNSILHPSDINDIWLSSDSGRSWSQIPASNTWSDRYAFQSVVLTNGDILVMGGATVIREDTTVTRIYPISLNDIYLSSDSGRSWSQIPASNHWSPRNNFQSVVLANNDILVMGGNSSYSKNDIWRSSDGGTNWSEITSQAPWGAREGFQTVVLTNNNILLIGGVGWDGSITRIYSSVWSSSDNGNSWNLIPAPSDETRYVSTRYEFQALVLENNELLIIGGREASGAIPRDIWTRQSRGIWTRQF